MSQITAEIIADSLNTFGNRITTIEVVFPRYILAELNTHRMFSRNSASSRAIPFKKMVESVKSNPFVPVAWQKDHSGMQGSDYLDDRASGDAIETWLQARDYAVRQAEMLNNNDAVTKQLANRLLEPFMYHTVLITATEWENFFALRCPQYAYLRENGETVTWFRSRKQFMAYDEETTGNKLPIHATEIGWLTINKGQADIHMMALAEAMWDAYNESKPRQLQPGEWHIPFLDNLDNAWVEFCDKVRPETKEKDDCESVQDLAIKVAVAQCARVSYTVVGEEDKPVNYENDIKLHDRLATSGHWSPFEHVARAMTRDEFDLYTSGKLQEKEDSVEGEDYIALEPLYKNQGWCGNFRGFIQYRKTFNNENITK